MLIFKIVHNLEWTAALMPKVFRGSAKDKEDGFLHFSTSQQLAGTLARHYADATDLVLVAVNVNALGDDLKWEPSRDGEIFPHLYSALNLHHVLWTAPIPRKPNGAFALPVQAFTDSTDA